MSTRIVENKWRLSKVKVQLVELEMSKSALTLKKHLSSKPWYKSMELGNGQDEKSQLLQEQHLSVIFCYSGRNILIA